MTMSTYSSLIQVDDHQLSRTFKALGVLTMKQFFYHDNFLDHYRYRNQIEYHKTVVIPQYRLSILGE